MGQYHEFKHYRITVTLKPIATFLIFLSYPIIAFSNCIDVSEVTPTSSFDIINDGTIVDIRTQLMWKQCGLGQNDDNSCSGNPREFNWGEALQAVSNFNTSGGFAGFTNWRLPNIKELSFIVEYACSDPAINNEIFPNTSSSHYWSSSPVVVGGAWTVNFWNGAAFMTSRERLGRVILVRDQD